MTVSVAINGFGRIGRLVLRAIAEHGRTDLVPTRINASPSMTMESAAHLFAFDSAHGRFAGQVEVSGNTITLRHNGKVYGPIPVTFERDPAKLELAGTDVVMECTGKFTSKEKCAPLLGAGARKVLISAPGDGVDAMIVYGGEQRRSEVRHDGDFGCVVHDQLPGADGEGAARPVRHSARLHGHHPRLYQ